MTWARFCAVSGRGRVYAGGIPGNNISLNTAPGCECVISRSSRVAARRLGISLSKFAARERLIERAAKFTDTERLVEKLQAMIGRIPHNGVIPRDHHYREPTALCMRGEGGGCLAPHGCVYNDGINPIVLQNLAHRNTAVRGTHPIAGMLKHGRDSLSYQALTVDDKYVLLIGHRSSPSMGARCRAVSGISNRVAHRRRPGKDSCRWTHLLAQPEQLGLDC